METIERKLENPVILKKVKKEFENFWGKEIPFQYIDDEDILSIDASDMTESKIVSLITENLFDIFYELSDEEFSCKKCGEFMDADNLCSNEPYLNFCLPCINEEESKKKLQEYFNSLRENGLLKEYKIWISRLYPQFRKYL